MLTPMQFKDFTFPHNPASYSITYRRIVQSDKIPFAFYRMQSLGLSFRVMSGEGAFSGADAYDNFRKLATVFYSDGPGLLLHPVWQPATAHFVSLTLLMEPRPDYVAYRFEFWEDTQKHSGALAAQSPDAPQIDGGDPTSLPQNPPSPTVHVVQSGDTIWSIAASYNTSVEQIAKKNPTLRKLGAIKAGFRLAIE